MGRWFHRGRAVPLIAAGLALALSLTVPAPTHAVFGDENGDGNTGGAGEWEPPVTTPTPTPGPNAFGWNNTNVHVNLFAVDYPIPGASGVKQIDYAQTGAHNRTNTIQGFQTGFYLINEGSTTITFHATDNAGNVEEPQSLTINIDKTPPSVIYSGNQGVYDVGDMINITCAAEDALSGIQTSTCQEITGPADSFAFGVHTFTATATDRADNTGSASVSFEVVLTEEGLCDLVHRYTIQHGVANSLCMKLRAAAAAKERGNYGAQANILDAFIQEVEAQDGQWVLSVGAPILIQMANTLKVTP